MGPSGNRQSRQVDAQSHLLTTHSCYAPHGSRRSAKSAKYKFGCFDLISDYQKAETSQKRLDNEKTTISFANAFQSGRADALRKQADFAGY